MSTANELNARVRMMGAHPDMAPELSTFIESVRDTEPMAMYGYESNHSRLQPLTEATVDRIIQHGKDGMIILSADRVERSEAENYQKRHELLADIKAQGLSYIVVYGGYRDMQTDPPKTANGETSFVIPAHYRDGKPVEWSKMEQFAKEMCGKYDQDSVLIQPPGEGPRYIDKNGTNVFDLGGPVVKNDLGQEYFSSLIKSKHYDEQNPDRLKRFSFTPSAEGNGEPQAMTDAVNLFVDPPPSTMGEMRRRGADGEIFALWDEIPVAVRR